MNREQDFFLQFGETGTSFWMGVVEDRKDVSMMGRVRVRIFGIHPMDRSEVPTDTLPWATVILPTTEAAMSGIGSGAPAIMEGTWVVGFFRDGISCQDPIVIGCVLTNAAPKWTGPSNLPDPEQLDIIAGKAKLGAETSKEKEVKQRNETLVSDINDLGGDIAKGIGEAFDSAMEDLGIKELTDFAEDALDFANQVTDLADNIINTVIPSISEKITSLFELPEKIAEDVIKDIIEIPIKESITNRIVMTIESAKNMV